MVNTLKLKAVILERGMTQEQVADARGISPVTLNRKINNKREFTVSEVKQLQTILKLTDEEVRLIFLP